MAKLRQYPDAKNYLAIELLEILYVHKPTQYQISRTEVFLRTLLSVMHGEQLNLLCKRRNWIGKMMEQYLKVQEISKKNISG